MSSYKEALDYLYHQLPMFQRQGPKAFKKDLTNIIELTSRLNNPERKLKCIHVAGTNGKGTTSHLMASILQSAGYRVGLYTSPHYKDFRERIKINGEFITEDSVVEFVEWFKAEEDINASFFEITVAMAFQYFSDQNVDIAVIETGLGGRLDSTNVVDPILSVITNISFDHVNFLGNTLELIAKEKAGIIKQERPVLIGRHQKETEAVFEQVAQQRDAELFYASELEQLGDLEPLIPCVLKAAEQEDEWLMNSPFFKENARTAIAAMQLLRDISPYEISDQAMFYGIIKVYTLTKFVGRWVKINDRPLTIGDSAHNQEGLAHVIETLIALKKPIHFVLGFVNDKDLNGILSLFPKEAKYYFAKADIPRGLNALELKEKAEEFSLDGDSFESITEAFKKAHKNATHDELIFVGGSIFTLAEVL